MSADCCNGKYYHLMDDMGYVYCSFWKTEFNIYCDYEENYLCDICCDMGGPCTRKKEREETRPSLETGGYTSKEVDLETKEREK